MFKKLTVLLFTAILVMVVPCSAIADEPVPIMNLNGDPLYFVNHVNPIILNGTVLVPLREFSEILGGKVNWNEADKTVDIKFPHAIASNPQKKVYLYPFECSKALIKGFILESNGQRKFFDWINTDNPSFVPQLECLDINNDQKDEIVAILTEGEGTGYVQTKIHVLNMDTLQEMEVENPLNYINKQVHTSITKILNELEISVKIGEKESYLCKRELPGSANENIYFGSIIKFELEDQNLCCSVPGAYSPAGFVGDFRIYYVYDSVTKSMKAFNIIFEDYVK